MVDDDATAGASEMFQLKVVAFRNHKETEVSYQNVFAVRPKTRCSVVYF